MRYSFHTELAHADVNMRLFQLSSIVLFALTACTPADKVPLSGTITVEYAGSSQSGDTVMFTLANGTTRAIHFRGSPDPAPGMVRMSCELTKETTIFVQGSVEPALRVKQIEVRPGERLHLNLWASSLPPDFKNHNSRCQLGLTLEGGTVVESSEFVP
jgi:hypothetical protein